MREGLKKFVLAMAIGGISAGAIAADDGEVGDTSVGKFDVKLIVPGKVAIWGLRDLGFTTDGTQTIQACVASSSASVQFLVNTTNNFELKDGSSKGADYTVTLAEKTGNGIQTETWGTGGLNNNQPSPINFSVAGATVPNGGTDGPINTPCSGSDYTIDVGVTVSNASTTDGTYTDNVTLTVSAI